MQLYTHTHTHTCNFISKKGNSKNKSNIIRKNIKWIIVIIFVAILCSSVSVFAYSYFANDIGYTKINGTRVNVKSALDELYVKKSNNLNMPKIEKIWSSSASRINYTYTVNEDGTYLVGALGAVGCNIETNSSDVISNDNNQNYTLKVIKAKNTDNIHIIANNGGGFGSNAFVVKLSNINVKKFLNENWKGDTTVKATYTAETNQEKVLTVSFSSGRDRINSSPEYLGTYLSTSYKDNNDCIDYSILDNGTVVTSSAYGYNWGVEAVAILQCE